MRKILICIILAAAIFCVGCSAEDSDSDHKNNDKKPDTNQSQDVELNEVIASIGTEGVQFEVGEITMQSEASGTAKIVAQVPDYTALFAAALEKDDPTGALEDAILEGNFATVKYEGTAAVLMVNGEQVVKHEKVVKQFVEQELIKAINALLEVEQ